MALPDNTRLSESEYLALEDATDIKHEYVDGRVVAMTGASARHIDITTNLIALLRDKLRGTPCRVHQSDMRVLVEATRSYFYPDLTVVCGERRFAPETNTATLLNPTLILEVLSPSTELYDRTTKFQQYQRIPALRDVVLVSQERPRIECFSRGNAETWVLTQAEGLDSTLRLPSIDVLMKLAEVYEEVALNG